MENNCEIYEVYMARLLEDQNFISKMQDKINPSLLSSKGVLQEVVEELAELLSRIISIKLEKELSALIEDNNRILQEIKTNFSINTNKQPNSFKQRQLQSDCSFSEIHNLIAEQKRKFNEQVNDVQVESTSIIDDVVEKVQQLNQKIKNMEHRYQTHFQGIWNVLRITQETISNFKKENKAKKIKEDEKDGGEKSLFNFWK